MQSLWHNHCICYQKYNTIESYFKKIISQKHKRKHFNILWKTFPFFKKKNMIETDVPMQRSHFKNVVSSDQIKILKIFNQSL